MASFLKLVYAKISRELNIHASKRERCKLARCSVICYVGENQLSCVFLSSMVPLSVNR